MDCITDKSCNLKRNLRFKQYDVINTKEQSVLNSIKDAFEGEDMQTQYSILGYRIDLYFHEYKLAIEVVELWHGDRNPSNEIERQKALQKVLNCVFIRINPDEKKFNIQREINKEHRHIKKREIKDLKEEDEKLKKDNQELKKENKELKKDKESLIDDISKKIARIKI